MQDTSVALDLGALLTGLGGGLALFLFGMRHMTEALKTVAGGSMKSLLQRLTANRFTGAVAGAVVTAVIQSSSVTTVLVVGFLTAGLLGFSQSVGVIIGANIGTTVTAQIVAFRIYTYGLLFIAVGFLAEAAGRSPRLRQWGAALMGLGLIFFGMELMSGATAPLRDYGPFIDAMSRMTNPWLAILSGAIFTAIIQSSSATTGLVIVLTAEGLVSLESGIGLVFGANIGTCVTALLSALGRPRQAMQAAVVHVIFNVLGVGLWIPFIPQLAQLVRSLAPDDLSRQVANAHTVFNVGNAFLFIWFTSPLARLLERLVPARPAAALLGQPRFLDDYFIDQPALALDRVRMELARLSTLVGDMLRRSIATVATGDHGAVERLQRADEEVTSLHAAIVGYLRRISHQSLVDPQPQQIADSLAIAAYLENIGDVVDDDLMGEARKRLRLGLVLSQDTASRLDTLHAEVCRAFDHAGRAIETGSHEAASEASGSKGPVKEVADDITSYLALRLSADEPHRVALFQLETDIVENLKRINTLTRRIGRVVLSAREGPRAEAHAGAPPPPPPSPT